MVSHDSPPNQGSNILHQFIVSDSVSSQTQFDHPHFDAYGSDLRGHDSFHHPTIQSLGERMSRSIDLVQAPPMAEDSHISHTAHLMNLLGAASEASHRVRGLSLSLSSHMTLNSNLITPNHFVCGGNGREIGDFEANENYSLMDRAFASSSNSMRSSPAEFFGSVLGNSRYLKPTQSLLEEIVNVNGKIVDLDSEFDRGRRGSLGLSADLRAELCSNLPFSAEKQENQLLIAKLIDLLEEVEGRFEKYCHQMEGIVHSFEVIAGYGAAKSYTALALKAMSRHFFSLRSAIISQINLEKRRLLRGIPKISAGLSQLSLFDRGNQSNRIALQPLGMIHGQRQAWRPIRCLPETSVTILRSWLFEHFLHPYPNDSEKLMLSSQTGLTKNQVSNWFINARVRLWKPMIEEMYKEEFGESSEDSNPLAGGSMAGESFTDYAED